jgi:hypothetical protein
MLDRHETTYDWPERRSRKWRKANERENISTVDPWTWIEDRRLRKDTHYVDG